LLSATLPEPTTTYLTKPNDFERLKRIVRRLYVGLVSRPPGPIPLLSEYRLDPGDRSEGYLDLAYL